MLYNMLQIIMLKSYVYFPDHINEELANLARITNISKAQLIREAVEARLEQTKKRQDDSSSINFLFEIAEIGKKAKFKGPKDSSARIDELLWSRDWSKENE